MWSLSSGASRAEPGSVKINEEFSAKFQIKLISELINTFSDVIRLHLQIFVIAKNLTS